MSREKNELELSKDYEGILKNISEILSVKGNETSFTDLILFSGINSSL